MSMREREGLIARIRQVRRLAAAGTRPEGRAADPEPDRFQALERRIAHMERMLEGFQDSVHRESERHGKLIAELQCQIQPGAMGTSLAEDARNRGL
jgi:hypothetical protein